MINKIFLLVGFLLVLTASSCKDDGNSTHSTQVPPTLQSGYLGGALDLVGEWYAHSLLYTDTIDANGNRIFIENEGSVGKYLEFQVVFTDETITTPYFDNYKYEVYGDSIMVFHPNDISLYLIYKDKFVFYGKDTLKMPNIVPSIAAVVPPLFGEVMLVRIK